MSLSDCAIMANHLNRSVNLMRVKKILCAVIFILAFEIPALALKNGVISKLNMTPEDFSSIKESIIKKDFSVISEKHSDDDEFIFFENLNGILMALDSGYIDEVELPEVVSDYILNTAPNFKAVCIEKTSPMFLSMGFKRSDRYLCDRINDVLKSMKADGSLNALFTVYIKNAGTNAPEIARFNKFDDAEEIKIAVTGDFPPLDYITPDDLPAGFNTAILAEIGRRLKKNITLVNIEAGSRTAALVSGRVDAVFWYMVSNEVESDHSDAPKDIILSIPYYEWDEFTHIGLK